MTVQTPDVPLLIRAADEAERIWIAGDTVHVVAGADDTGGAYTMLTVEGAPGGGPFLYPHDREEAAFHVLAGVPRSQHGDAPRRGRGVGAWREARGAELDQAAEAGHGLAAQRLEAARLLRLRA